MTKKVTTCKTKRTILLRIKELYYRLYRFWNNKVLCIHKEINWFFQRGRRGYSDCDVWEFHSYLSKVIYNGLVQLKEIKHGVPATLNKKTGIFDYNVKRWDNILDKMIRGFKLLNDIESGDRSEYSPQMDKTFRKDYNCLNKKEDKQIEESFELLQKHFRKLWD